MKTLRIAILLIIIGCVTAAFIDVLLLSDTEQEWSVNRDGFLHYSIYPLQYQLSPLSNNTTLYEVRFISRDDQIAGLLRKPQVANNRGLSGIVLLPGATVTKEREQELAKYLGSLGYASITFDQRNLGVVNIQDDLRMFMNRKEPTEYKMVHDALVAAEILRNQPEIDPNRIVYIGESNGGRFAIIACALDPIASGVIAISTCGYGTDARVGSGNLKDPDIIRFYRSIDPETYLSMISPREFLMIHSLKDPIIPFEYANRTYTKAYDPKAQQIVECGKHGYCTEMNVFLEKDLMNMAPS
jgi:fermentation-respiration switch protein FrsA (DUF1100 family)